MVLRRTVPKTASWFLTFSEKPEGLISSWPTLGTNASPSHHDFGSMGLCLTPNLKKAFSLPHLSKLFHFTLYQITYISCSYQFITCSFKCSPDIPLENSSLNGGIFSSIFHGSQRWNGCSHFSLSLSEPCPSLFCQNRQFVFSIWLASSTFCENSSVKLSVIPSHSV